MVGGAEVDDGRWAAAAIGKNRKSVWEKKGSVGPISVGPPPSLGLVNCWAHHQLVGLTDNMMLKTIF